MNISDTLSKYDCFLDLRHLSEYPYQNFWVFLTTTAPNNVIFKDTIELRLADLNGKWLGKTASGNIITHHILFQRNMHLRVPGTYSFTFENAMRENDLKYISDLGLAIQKSKLK